MVFVVEQCKIWGVPYSLTTISTSWETGSNTMASVLLEFLTWHRSFISKESDEDFIHIKRKALKHMRCVQIWEPICGNCRKQILQSHMGHFGKKYGIPGIPTPLIFGSLPVEMWVEAIKWASVSTWRPGAMNIDKHELLLLQKYGMSIHKICLLVVFISGQMLLK